MNLLIREATLIGNNNILKKKSLGLEYIHVSKVLIQVYIEIATFLRFLYKVKGFFNLSKNVSKT